MTMPFQPYNYPMGMNPMMGRNYPPNPPATLYIGNLDENVHEEQLYAHFSRFGTIHSVKIVKDRMTGKSRGFGYVNFFNIKDAENARMLSQYEKLGKKPIRILHKGDPKKPEANLFVKNIDTSLTNKELHNYFSKCGPVVSVKIANDKSGNSLGYGYVQFEKPEDADKAIEELNGTKLKEQEIGVEKFKPRGSRAETTNNNLYVKHLPEGKSKEEIEKLLNDVFGNYGKVHSLLAISKDGKTWSAFVCYESEESAERALEALSGKVTLQGADQPLYVNLHASRDRRAQDQGESSKEHTSLFIKNLNPEVTEEELVGVLKAFGEIASATVKQTEHGGKKYGMAFVNFKYSQDAANAQTYARDKEEVKNLFYEKSPYIGFLMNKEQRERYKQLKSNTMFHQQPNPYMQKQMMPMQMYPPQFQPNFYPQNYGGMGRFPPQNPMQQQQQMQQRPNWMGGQFNQQQQQQQPQQQTQQFNQQQQFNPNYPRQNQQMYRSRQGAFGNQGQRPQGRPYQGQQQRHPGQQGEPNQNFNRGGYQKPRQNQTQPQKFQQETNPSMQQRPEKEATSKPTETHGVQLTVQNLKDKLDEFLKLDQDRQRNILGEMLFPRVLGIAGPINAPKITGMLVDFDVLTVQEILELLEDNEVLRERVQEAQELIEQEGN